jgi:hypothetical protein
MTSEEIEDIIGKLKNGEQVDLALGGNGVRSSKDCIGNPQEDGTLIVSVWHSISDAWSTFTEEGFRAVLRGESSVWDGDIPEDDDDPERDENGDIVDYAEV